MHFCSSFQVYLFLHFSITTIRTRFSKLEQQLVFSFSPLHFSGFKIRAVKPFNMTRYILKGYFRFQSESGGVVGNTNEHSLIRHTASLFQLTGLKVRLIEVRVVENNMTQHFPKNIFYFLIQQGKKSKTLITTPYLAVMIRQVNDCDRSIGDRQTLVNMVLYRIQQLVLMVKKYYQNGEILVATICKCV